MKQCAIRNGIPAWLAEEVLNPSFSNLAAKNNIPHVAFSLQEYPVHIFFSMREKAAGEAFLVGKKSEKVPFAVSRHCIL